MKALIFIALIWAGIAQAQNTNIVLRSDELPKIIASLPVDIISEQWSDTIPVWVVYLDSTRVFSAYPEYNIELEVAPGWRVNYGWKSEWYDQDGRRFNPDNVILDRPRKPRRNPFKE
jgi:hypothetical protein